METYFVAQACVCMWPSLEFEPNHCARCGRWIVLDVQRGSMTSLLAALDERIEERRLLLLDEAEEAGVDVDDREAYLSWLEARVEAPSASPILS